MGFPTVSQYLFCLAAAGLVGTFSEILCLSVARSRRTRMARKAPSVSILKPLCGLDDGLLENLQSHLDTSYPGDMEMLLGLRSERDPAFPLARAFAQAHPEQVRIVMQTGEPGHNPKVNQLIYLTRAARHELLVLTDSNIRVHHQFLQEIAAEFERPGVGLVSHLIAGVGERGLGAVLDNLTLAAFVAPNIAASAALHFDEVIGKGLSMRRDVLASVGGWHAVKDVLAEDHHLARLFAKQGLRIAYCPTPIQNVQIHQPLQAFWDRQTRWLMIRYRNLFPGLLVEPVQLPVFISLVALMLSPTRPWAWTMFGLAFALEAALTQASARLLRGYGFKLQHLALIPLRETLYFFAYLRSSTMGWVNWRGNRLMVLVGTRLAEPSAFARVKKMQKLARAESGLAAGVAPMGED